jgi:predicted ATPase
VWQPFRHEPDFGVISVNDDLDELLARTEEASMKDGTFLTRVVIDNYKSIASCDVHLGPLTFLIGPNGAGKSNFIDALRFIADALNHSLGYALENRGGGARICHLPHRHEGAFGIRLEFTLPTGAHGYYAVRIGLPAGAVGVNAGWEVVEESCSVEAVTNGAGPASFALKGANLVSTVGEPPALVNDRLFLVNAAGRPEFRPVFDALARMQFYQIRPQAVVELPTFESGRVLRPDGSNLANVLFELGMHSGVRDRIEDYLRVVLPGFVRLRLEPVTVLAADRTVEPTKIALLFDQAAAGGETQSFWASQMSEGTRRALGILTALLQGMAPNGPRMPLLAIEEPEAQVHAAVLGVLRDAMVEASARTQVLVTTHSSDLLDDKEVDSSSLLTVVAEAGVTRIGPLDEADRGVLRDRLFTAGELLRAGQLALTPNELPHAEAGKG